MISTHPFLIHYDTHCGITATTFLLAIPLAEFDWYTLISNLSNPPLFCSCQKLEITYHKYTALVGNVSRITEAKGMKFNSVKMSSVLAPRWRQANLSLTAK